jgi:hypothetical protein
VTDAWSRIAIRTFGRAWLDHSGVPSLDISRSDALIQIQEGRRGVIRISGGTPTCSIVVTSRSRW